MAKMPKAVLNHFKAKKPHKSNRPVPPALKQWHKNHPNAKNAHKGG